MGEIIIIRFYFDIGKRKDFFLRAKREERQSIMLRWCDRPGVAETMRYSEDCYCGFIAGLRSNYEEFLPYLAFTREEYAKARERAQATLNELQQAGFVDLACEAARDTLQQLQQAGFGSYSEFDRYND